MAEGERTHRSQVHVPLDFAGFIELANASMRGVLLHTAIFIITAMLLLLLSASWVDNHNLYRRFVPATWAFLFEPQPEATVVVSALANGISHFLSSHFLFQVHAFICLFCLLSAM